MSKMIQGSIDDANFAALSESMEAAGSSAADAVESLEKSVNSDYNSLIAAVNSNYNSLIAAVNSLTKAVDYSNIVTELTAICDAIDALNKED